MLEQANMHRVVEVLQGIAETSASLHRLVKQPAELMIDSGATVIADAMSYQQVILIACSVDCTKMLVSSSSNPLSDSLILGELNPLIRHLRNEIAVPECIMTANLSNELAADAKSLGLSDLFLAAPLLKSTPQASVCPNHGLIIVQPLNFTNIDIDRAALEILSAMLVSTIEINRCLQAVTASNTTLRRAIQTPVTYPQPLQPHS